MNVHYGKPYGMCGYCGKYVKLSGLFAGIHICVDDATRQTVDRLNEVAKLQQRVGQAKRKPRA
jgi:hypothetical protein